MAIMKKLHKRGFTLIELMIVVVIIGVLAALAIYGVNKYVANSKSAEARNFLGRIAKDSLSKFEGENTSDGVVQLGNNAVISRSLCPDSADSVPANADMTPTAPADIQGKKFQSQPSDWNDGAGFACLKSSLVDPQYYAYGYDTTDSDINPAEEGAMYTAYAVGDLDGDAVPSMFTLPGQVQSDDSNNLVLTAAPTVTEQAPEE